MPSNHRIRKHFTVNESDVTIITESENYISIAISCLYEERRQITEVIRSNPEFKSSFSPYFIPEPPTVIKRMQDIAKLAEVGPMACVAGVLADMMCERMVDAGARIAVVENGGEIMIRSEEDIHIGLYSHTTTLKDKVGFLYHGGSSPLGIGTSSGTFGHAISLGKADTVTVFAHTAGLADAFATKIANSVKRKENKCVLESAINLARSSKHIQGVFITCGNDIAKVGKIPELVFS